MLSLLRSSIAVTGFSFSSAGARSASLSATSPAELLGQRRGVGQQRDDRILPVPEDAEQLVAVEDEQKFTCWLRCDRIPVTSAALLSEPDRTRCAC